MSNRDDLEAIHSTLEIADRYGLRAEVMWSAMQAMTQGMSIEQACAFGLSEWDL